MLELPKDEINYYQLHKINNWTFEEISQFEKMKKIVNQNDFIDCLNTIYEYKLPFNKVNILNKKYLHQVGIKSFYKSSYNREIDDLLKEHELILKEKEMIHKNKNNDSLISQRIKRIKQLSNNYTNTKINITKETINETKNIYLKENYDELIAIVNNAVKIIYGYQLRDSQIYSLLILLEKEKSRGKITQILSGEGKTLIINCLAIILVLKGHKVDIVTSNPILATRDSEESKELYNYFGISVGNNIDKEEQIMALLEGEKTEVYNKDIIYGTTLEYQGDILDDEYNLSGIRNNRGFDIVIVDEIDSMLIDEYSYKTRLATTKPFLEKYSIFLQILWGYYINLHLRDEEVVNDEELCKELSKYLKKKMVDIINIKNEKSKYYFPMCPITKGFALDQLDNWINSLIRCLKMEKDKEYIIKANDIVPVDQDNTGVIQKSMTLSHGLHQFLQMKHNLPVTPISIVTNYLSNLGFFKRYIRQNLNSIYGMTGTLGSKKARELLADVYNLDFDYIPPNSPRILKELTSSISFDHSHHIKNIKRIVKRETDGGRAILLICESIGSANEIYEEIKINYPNLNLIKIIGEDNEDKKIPSALKPKTVIISTNISGRGTDLKLEEEVLKNGGLHVIITFIPNNSRVEEQNYGRAGRKGEPGTWQLVIDYQEMYQKYFIITDLENRYMKYLEIVKNINLQNINDTNDQFINKFSIEYLRCIREEREIKRINSAMKDIVTVDKEDHLFNLYCEMLNQNIELRKEENKIYLDSIEEKWAIFLYNLNLMNKSWAQVNDEFNKFKNKIIEELNNNNIIQNPGFYNKYVNEKLSLICDYEKEKSIIGEVGDAFIDTINRAKEIFSKNQDIYKYDQYINFCNLSIDKDPNSFIPYFLRSICKILQGREGLEDLKISSMLINREIEAYKNLYSLLNILKINSDFIFYQINILNNIKIHIIDQNIKDYNNKNANNFKIKKKKFDDVFSFNNKTNNKDNNDRKIPKYLDKYFKTIRDNGLQYFYFIKEKASLFKAALMIGVGIGLIALSIYTSGIIGGAKGAIGSTIGIILGSSTIINQIDDIIKGEHDRTFPNSYDIGFFEFLKGRKKIRKYTQLNLDEIFGKYDTDYERKKLKEDEKNFKNEFIKNYKRIGLTNKELEFINEIEEEFDTEISSDSTNISVEQKHNSNNKKCEYFKSKLEKKKKEIKKNLKPIEKKSILGNIVSRAAGNDLIKNDKEDIHDEIKKNHNNLENVGDIMLIEKIKKLYNNEIEKKREELKNNSDKIKKKSNEYDLKKQKLTEESKNLDYKLEKINKKNSIIKQKKDNYNKKSETFNNETDELDEDIEKMNEIISRINNGDNSISINDNEKQNLQKRISDNKKKREEINKEKEEINKEIGAVEEERKNYNKDIDEYNDKKNILDKEKENLNNLIDKSNKNYEKFNEHIEYFNKLRKVDLLLDFDGENIKLDIKEPPNKLNDLIKLETIIKKVEDNANSAFDKELEHLARNEIEKENNEKVLIIKEKFDNKLKQILFEKHSNWDNLFNKSVYDDKYLYNYDDMKKIVKYNLKKIIKKDFYYISDLENHKSLEKMKEYLKNKKLVFGNCLGNENNIWNSFCLVPNNDDFIFLYKSSTGKYPSEKLKNLITNIIDKNYIQKINYIKENNDNIFTEVDSIENIKIIAEKLVNNDKEFIKNFETYKNFYKEDNDKKIQKKKDFYPKEFIKSNYDSLKKRNNSSRISLGLFKKYYLDLEKEQEIEMDFFKTIYQILINYDEIEKKEKDILEKEYNNINRVYYKNKFNDDNIKEDERVDVNDNNNNNDIKNKINKIKSENNNFNSKDSNINYFPSDSNILNLKNNKNDIIYNVISTANNENNSDTNEETNSKNNFNNLNRKQGKDINETSKNDKKEINNNNYNKLIKNIYSEINDYDNIIGDKIKENKQDDFKENSSNKNANNKNEINFEDIKRHNKKKERDSKKKKINVYNIEDIMNNKKIKLTNDNKINKAIENNYKIENHGIINQLNKSEDKIKKNRNIQINQTSNEIISSSFYNQKNIKKKFKTNEVESINDKNILNKTEIKIIYKNVKTEENNTVKFTKLNVSNKFQDKAIKQHEIIKNKSKIEQNLGRKKKKVLKTEKSYEILYNNELKKDYRAETLIKRSISNEKSIKSIIISRAHPKGPKNKLVKSKAIKNRENKINNFKDDNEEKPTYINLEKNNKKSQLNNISNKNLKESKSYTFISITNKIGVVKKNVEIMTEDKNNKLNYTFLNEKDINKISYDNNHSKTPNKSIKELTGKITQKKNISKIKQLEQKNLLKNISNLNKSATNINNFGDKKIKRIRKNNQIIQEKNNKIIDYSSRNNETEIYNKKKSKSPLIVSRNIRKEKEKDKTIKINDKDERKKYEIKINKDLQIIKDIIYNFLGKDNTKLITSKNNIMFVTKMFYENKKLEFKLNLIQIGINKFTFIGEHIEADSNLFGEVFLNLKNKLK